MALLHNIAVLIDADNASAKTIGTVFSEIEKLGKIGCKKIYGDWGQDNLKGWQEVILRYAIDPMQQFAYVKGKNATDIALVIEAMDLLHSGKYDGFCLVSSDSDFASLAVRIRKNNLPVFGFGKENAVISFRQACDKFFEVREGNKNNLSQKTIDIPQPISKPKVIPFTTSQLKCDTRLLNTLRQILSEKNNQTTDSWVNYALLTQKFKDSKIDLNKYGYPKLINLLQNIDIFETKKEGSTQFIRLKKPVKTNACNSIKSKTLKVNQRYSTEQLKQETQFINIIEKIIQDNITQHNDWCYVSHIATELKRNYPHIDTKKYGYAKFSALIKALDSFEIKQEANQFLFRLKTKDKIYKDLSLAKKSENYYKPISFANNPYDADYIDESGNMYWD